MTLDSQLHIVICPPAKSFNAGRENAIMHKIANRLTALLVSQYNINEIAVRPAGPADIIPEERKCLDDDYVAVAIVSDTFCAGARDVSNFYDGHDDKHVDDDGHIDIGLWIIGVWQSVQNGAFDDWLCQKMNAAVKQMLEQEKAENGQGDDIT